MDMVVQLFQYSFEKPEISNCSIRKVCDSVHATWPDCCRSILECPEVYEPELDMVRMSGQVACTESYTFWILERETSGFSIEY